MFTFTFDQKYFFNRQPMDDYWCAHTRERDSIVREGYFAVVGGSFHHHGCDSSKFCRLEIEEIEQILRDNSQAMDLDQFRVHEQLPSHYRPIAPESNRYADIIRRMRIYGEWDVNTSIALSRLEEMNPAYRLTREFVAEVLEMALGISKADHDEWLRDDSFDSWTYDRGQEPPNFEDFFAQRLKQIYLPDNNIIFDSDNQTLYEIEGLPNLYLLYEEATSDGEEDSLIESGHFIDLRTVVAPVSLPDNSGIAYYII